MKTFLATVQSSYPEAALKGQPFDSLLRLLDRSPTSLDEGELQFLYDFLGGADHMALALQDEKQRRIAISEQEVFVKNLQLHALESPNAAYQRKALDRLEALMKRGALSRADQMAIREKSKGIPWNFKFALLHHLGLSSQEKKEILALENATPVDSLAISRYLKKVAEWGQVKYRQPPGDTLREAFIAFPVPRLMH